MEQRIRELVDKLNEYSKAYYVLDAPKISDKEYDELYDELSDLRYFLSFSRSASKSNVP